MATTAQHTPPTKARLLDAAERLMLAKGFVATTVDEICEAAKLTKGSFFHYFETKEQLGKELLERFCQSARDRMRAAAVDDDPLARVYAQIDGAIKMSRECADQSCLLGTFAQELSDTHPDIRSLCADAFGQWADALRKDLDAAKARHAPKSSIDSKGLADHFIAILEGSKILAKAKRDPAIVERSLKHFKQYLMSLFGTKR